MSTGIRIMHIIVVLLLLIGLPEVNSLPCADSRCKTGSCNSSGDCICNLPDPSTILDGDRPFLGGKFCDEEMTMCDGTKAFWCERGGKCDEIVQGEKYECKCLPGYTGKNCEHSGKPCGQSFCFHQAECLVQGDVCDCPPDWKGSADCSLPTESQTDSSASSAKDKFPQDKSSNITNWMVPVLAVTCSTGAAAGGAVYAKKLFRKKSKTPSRFQQLSQMQSHDTLDDDENDSMIHNDTSHL